MAITTNAAVAYGRPTVNPKKDNFYMIYAVGGKAPTMCHATMQIAREEAERLARNNPEMMFVIMQSYSRISVAPAPIVEEPCN